MSENMPQTKQIFSQCSQEAKEAIYEILQTGYLDISKKINFILNKKHQIIEQINYLELERKANAREAIKSYTENIKIAENNIYKCSDFINKFTKIQDNLNKLINNSGKNAIFFLLAIIFEVVFFNLPNNIEKSNPWLFILLLTTALLFPLYFFMLWVLKNNNKNNLVNEYYNKKYRMISGLTLQCYDNERCLYLSNSYEPIDLGRLGIPSIELYLKNEKESDAKTIEIIKKVLGRYEHNVQFYKSECERFENMYKDYENEISLLKSELNDLDTEQENFFSSQEFQKLAHYPTEYVMAIKEGNSIYFDLTIEFLNTRQADTLKEAFALVKDFVYKRQNKMMQQKMMQRLNNQAMYFQENISQLSDSMNSVLAESKRANKNIQSAISASQNAENAARNAISSANAATVAANYAAGMANYSINISRNK
ncbi:TPA: hypothetical protein ACFNMI_000950 [Neisseria bacilliformis]|nr:hypothetical protein [Neisseria bacilliformis]QMT46771.1 hypothetical protein H3L91_07375 [Neisseria bacilliformis]